MKPAAFEYHRARTPAGAVGLLTELGDDAKIIAGGQSLVAMMNFRLARPEHLVDITHVDSLRGIAVSEGEIRIGALTTHREVEKAGLGVLSAAMRWVGHLPIRTRGTVGGSIAHADATAEWCLLAVLFDARIVVEGPSGVREIRASEFFLGPFTTALGPDELITALVFPSPPPRAALTEYADRRGDFALVAAAVDLDADRVVLGGVGAVPTLVSGKWCSGTTYRARAAAAAGSLELRDEPGISAHYRRGLVRTLVERAYEEAANG
ncbi:FAD binding domain-containing protein [Pseudonocardia oroxyli]|uniref:Carbon-monoxide dehydrogenase medium subunit n=1 Tax=Pseudonocardia oroxyli TaxID=366584 RepID=A0A1G7V097_PSEOR|nr:FAD binding domain-containing protein [Pseudonocardia oroxyli]SDG53176.1 carbon-monoxide dehydrogenase medium subunit [Pseudonocardia oroxyli]